MRTVPAELLSNGCRARTLSTGVLTADAAAVTAKVGAGATWRLTPSTATGRLAVCLDSASPSAGLRWQQSQLPGRPSPNSRPDTIHEAPIEHEEHCCKEGKFCNEAAGADQHSSPPTQACLQQGVARHFVWLVLEAKKKGITCVESSNLKT